MKRKKPVRAVIDTNLFISGLFASKGAAQQLQDLWAAGAFELAVWIDFEKTKRRLKKKITLPKPSSILSSK